MARTRDLQSVWCRSFWPKFQSRSEGQSILLSEKLHVCYWKLDFCWTCIQGYSIVKSVNKEASLAWIQTGILNTMIFNFSWKWMVKHRLFKACSSSPVCVNTSVDLTIGPQWTVASLSMLREHHNTLDYIPWLFEWLKHLLVEMLNVTTLNTS